MASSSSSSLLFLFAYVMLPTAASLSFSFPSFNSSTEQFIAFQNDTFLHRNVICLTKNGYETQMNQSVGRAYYKIPIPLHNPATGKFADFTTHFSIVINAKEGSNSGDGMAFFLSPFPSVVPPHSAGSTIGLIESRNSLNEFANKIVAVEFDTFQNEWDPNDNHIGINVNSMKSAATFTWYSSSITDGNQTANVWISYNATTTNLSVFLTYEANPIFAGNSSLYHIVNLSKILPDEVAIGFSASTGDFVETHEILSWEFYSTTLDPVMKNRVGLIIVVVVGTGLLLVAASLVWFFFLRKRKNAGGFGGEEECVEDIDDGEGECRRNSPLESSRPRLGTFADELKLGQGGFGGVYRGFIAESNLDVAIKRVSKESKQGKKEYISEVKIISRLRHRNLVQLVGWCHERKELLLVYEFMPNGSLDSYLYSRDSNRYLIWPLRYRKTTFFFWFW